jgi:hypothetical protein
MYKHIPFWGDLEPRNVYQKVLIFKTENQRRKDSSVQVHAGCLDGNIHAFCQVQNLIFRGICNPTFHPAHFNILSF